MYIPDEARRRDWLTAIRVTAPEAPNPLKLRQDHEEVLSKENRRRLLVDLLVGQQYPLVLANEAGTIILRSTGHEANVLVEDILSFLAAVLAGVRFGSLYPFIP